MSRLLLLFASVFVAILGCRRQNATGVTPSNAGATECTLDICGDRKIQNPTEADLRQAVLTLDDTKGDAFLVLGRTEMTYMQTSGDSAAGFVVEYQEADTSHHYRATRHFTADEIVQALISYSTGSQEWKKAAEWTLVTW